MFRRIYYYRMCRCCRWEHIRPGKGRRLYDEEFSLLADMDTDWFIKLQRPIPVFAKILID